MNGTRTAGTLLTAKAVSLEGARKRFGSRPALTGVDLDVAPGEVHALVGRNGAGLTTIQRIVAGFVRPDEGSVTVLGVDARTDGRLVRSRVSFAGQNTGLWPGASGRDMVELLGRAGDGPTPSLVARLARDLDLDLRRRFHSYAAGDRQKLILVAALSRRRDLYVLDDPTAILDPTSSTVVVDEVLRVRAAGASVLWSSHKPAELTSAYDRLTVIEAGRGVRTETLASLSAGRLRHGRAVIVQDTRYLSSLPDVHNLVRDGDVVRFAFSESALPKVLSMLVVLHARDVTLTSPDLDDRLLDDPVDQPDPVTAAPLLVGGTLLSVD